MVNRLASTAMVTSVAVMDALPHIEGRVLDVGCGSKPFKRLVYLDGYAEPVTEWVGLDVRPVGEIQADMMDMPVEDAEFDTVVCVDSLQYANNPIRALAEMARVLKTGGKLLLICPNVAAEDESAYFTFKMRGLLEWCNTLGLNVIDAKTASKLFEHEFQNFANTDAGRVWPGEVRGFVNYLDDTYPALNVIVAVKE